MLSTKLSASGSNLQCANNVILLDPPGFNAADGSALEQQAVARSVRLGQTRRVTVTRFMVKDSIEVGLYHQNARARSQNRAAALQDNSYRCHADPAAAVAVAAAAIGGTTVTGPARAGGTLMGPTSALLCLQREKLERTAPHQPVLQLWQPQPVQGPDAAAAAGPAVGAMPQAPQPNEAATTGPGGQKRAADSSLTAMPVEGKRARTGTAAASLASMGFQEGQAERALLACDHSFERALEMLLQGNVPPTEEEVEAIVID